MEVLLAPDAPPLLWGNEQSPEKVRTENGQVVMQNGRPTYKVSHFPYLKLVCRKYGLLPEVGTPFFPIGVDGWNQIENYNIHRIENGAEYSPYFPPKKQY